MMELRVRGNSHARCETGEKVESGAVAPLRPYLSSSDDPQSVEMLATIKTDGVERTLTTYSELTSEDPLYHRILEVYRALGKH